MRTRTAIALVCLLAVGLTATYGSTAFLGAWGRRHAGGVLYVVFWALALQFSRPQGRPGVHALIAFIGTCMIEALQLVHVPWLDALRTTRVGEILLGSTFDWFDVPHYALGAGLAVCVLLLFTLVPTGNGAGGGRPARHAPGRKL